MLGKCEECGCECDGHHVTCPWVQLQAQIKMDQSISKLLERAEKAERELAVLGDGLEIEYRNAQESEDETRIAIEERNEARNERDAAITARQAADAEVAALKEQCDSALDMIRDQQRSITLMTLEPGGDARSTLEIVRNENEVLKERLDDATVAVHNKDLEIGELKWLLEIAMAKANVCGGDFCRQSRAEGCNPCGACSLCVRDRDIKIQQMDAALSLATARGSEAEATAFNLLQRMVEIRHMFEDSRIALTQCMAIAFPSAGGSDGCGTVGGFKAEVLRKCRDILDFESTK